LRRSWRELPVQRARPTSWARRRSCGPSANIVTWTDTGYNVLIIFAALQAVPVELSEAAHMDGAGPWRIAWSIKIPLVRPALILTAVFSIIGTLQLFTEPIVLRAISTNVTSGYTPNLLAFSIASGNNYPTGRRHVGGAGARHVRAVVRVLPVRAEEGMVMTTAVQGRKPSTRGPGLRRRRHGLPGAHGRVLPDAGVLGCSSTPRSRSAIS
jgi:hypothetical protein